MDGFNSQYLALFKILNQSMESRESAKSNLSLLSKPIFINHSMHQVSCGMLFVLLYLGAKTIFCDSKPKPKLVTHQGILSRLL